MIPLLMAVPIVEHIRGFRCLRTSFRVDVTNSGPDGDVMRLELRRSTARDSTCEPTPEEEASPTSEAEVESGFLSTIEVLVRIVFILRSSSMVRDEYIG